MVTIIKDNNVIVEKPSSTVSRLGQWLNKQWKWLLGICLAGFILGLGIYIYNSYQNYNKTKAFEKLYLSHNIEEFQDVIDHYKGSVADEIAYFELTKDLLGKGEKAEAKTKLELYQTLYPNSFLCPYALLSLAALIEDEGKTEEAIRIYQQILDTKAFAYAWNNASYSMCAALVNEGRLDEAKKLLSSLKESAKNPAWSARIAVLEEYLSEDVTH
ncbi:MAG: tetratricopeptide repeat protein [Chlamydiota bacterium]|nr:tetratricopeptide repeat protein [Chlamydiota bacterium]